MPTPRITSALDAKSRATTGDALQGTLVDLLDLALVGKQAHWNLVGPRFRSVHLQLDELVLTARTYSDTVAERAVAIGFPVDGRAATVAKETGLADFPHGLTPDARTIDYFVGALRTVVGRLRVRIAATEQPDPVTSMRRSWLTGSDCSVAAIRSRSRPPTARSAPTK